MSPVRKYPANHRALKIIKILRKHETKKVRGCFEEGQVSITNRLLHHRVRLPPNILVKQMYRMRSSYDPRTGDTKQK